MTVRRDIPIQNLAQVAQAGGLRFVVDYYDVCAPPAENQWVYLERMESLLGLDADDDRGFYEADGYDVTIQNELEVCDIDDEPRWQATIYSAGDDEDDEDDAEEEDEDETN